MPGFCGSFSDRTGIQGDDSSTFDVRDGRSIAHGTRKWGPSTACPQVSAPLAVPPLPWGTKERADCWGRNQPRDDSIIGWNTMHRRAQGKVH